MSNPNNPSNPQGSVQPPWLAKLNAASAQAEQAISHTQIEIEQPTKTPIEHPQSQQAPAPIVQVETDHIPPGIYQGATIQSNSAGDNVVNIPATGHGVVLNFNAAEFAQAIGRGSRAEASVEVPTPDDAIIEFKTGSLEAQIDHLISADKVQLDDEYKAHLLSKDKVQLNQEFGLFGHGSPELDADAAKLEALAGEGAAGPTFADLQTPHFQSVDEAMLPDDQIPGMPSDWKPPVVVDLPEVVDVESKPLVQPASSVVDYVSADKDQPVVSEEEYYAAIVAQLRPSNPTEASLIERLRLFQSQYVGLITTPEQAIDHIAQCRRDNTPIGGSDAVELSAQSTSLKHKQYIERRYAPHKAKREIVEAARKSWKDAIAQKEAAMKQWDAFVKWHHDNYARLKKMPAESFLSYTGCEDNAQSN